MTGDHGATAEGGRAGRSEPTLWEGLVHGRWKAKVIQEGFGARVLESSGVGEWYEHAGIGRAVAEVIQHLARQLRAVQGELEAALKLAYMGEHRFPQNSYKARLEEVVPALRRAEAERDALRAMLDKSQWVIDTGCCNYVRYCPECESEEPNHDERCELAALLAPHEGGRGGEAEGEDNHGP